MRKNWIMMVAILVSMFCVMGAHADGLPLGLDDDNPQIFILNKDAVMLFGTGAKPSKIGKKKVSGQGTIYHAKNKSGDFYLLGKWDDNIGAFTKILGWVGKDDFIRQVNPLTVGEAVKMKLLNGYKKNNALPLRVMSKPQKPLIFMNEPGGKRIEKGGFKYSQYYVYDGKTKDGKNYFLIGEPSKIVDEPLVFDTAIYQGPLPGLKGWIEADFVQEWCNNLVLEYNSEKDAVEERYTNEMPAVIYEANTIQSELLAKEPLKAYWKHCVEQNSSGDAEDSKANFDPIGIHPDVERLLILDKKDKWFNVASLGSITGEKLGETDIGQLKSKLNKTVANLKKVDVCFVVDATGSMRDEIDAVGDFLLDLCTAFANVANNGTAKITFQKPGSDVFLFDAGVDICVSLVLYQDIGAEDISESSNKAPFQTKVIFQGVSLKTGRTELRKIKKFLDAGKLEGGTEAMHNGLLRSLTESEIWRKNAYERVLILIADEPGDSGGANQKDVLNAMPAPNDVDGNHNEDKIKRTYTHLYAIYTGDTGYRKFKKNLKELTDKSNERIVNLPDFKKHKSADKDMLKQHLCIPIEVAQENVIKTVNLAFDKVTKDDQPSREQRQQITQKSSLDLQEWAVELAAKEAGTSIEELRRLTKGVAYLKGWTQLNQEGLTHDVYRERVYISQPKLLKLQRDMDGFAEQLNSTIKGEAGQWRGASPQETAVEAFILAVAKASGDDKVVEDKEVRRELVKDICGGEYNESLIKFLRISRDLPVTPKSGGLLGMTVHELRNLNIKKLSKMTKHLANKARCLKNILDGYSCPEDYMDVVTQERIPKNWIHKVVMANTTELYCYVPIQYLP